MQVQVQFALINIVDVSTEDEHIELQACVYLIGFLMPSLPTTCHFPYALLLQGWWRMYWNNPLLAWNAEVSWNSTM